MGSHPGSLPWFPVPRLSDGFPPRFPAPRVSDGFPPQVAPRPSHGFSCRFPAPRLSDGSPPWYPAPRLSDGSPPWFPSPRAALRGRDGAASTLQLRRPHGQTRGLLSNIYTVHNSPSIIKLQQRQQQQCWWGWRQIHCAVTGQKSLTRNALRSHFEKEIGSCY